MNPLENVTTPQPRHNHSAISLIAIAISTKVGLVAIEGTDVQSKLGRRHFATREGELG